MARDTRDDLLEPTRGRFVSAEGSVAARALGGEVGFIKTYVQGFTFHRLPGRKPVVLASRAALGLADGFEREVQPTDDDGNPIPGPPIVVDDLPASERFFAGGDTTIRGFALDRVGAPNTISANGYPDRRQRRAPPQRRAARSRSGASSARWSSWTAATCSAA